MNKNERKIDFDAIYKLLHENAETGFKHTTYQEESKRFHYLLNGDKRAIKEAVKVLNPDIQGKLSDNRIRNMRYLFIINTALATRYLIEAGIPQETVYSASDVYIQRADVTETIDDFYKLTEESWSVFLEMVKSSKKEEKYSKPVLECLTYIDSHFNNKITLEEVGEKLGLNSCYLATLFKKETGTTFGEYVADIRTDTAKVLLSKTDYTFTQIAYSLAFCSQSHFTNSFKKRTGLTPRQYREKYFNAHLLVVGK